MDDSVVGVHGSMGRPAFSASKMGSMAEGRGGGSLCSSDEDVKRAASAFGKKGIGQHVSRIRASGLREMRMWQWQIQTQDGERAEGGITRAQQPRGVF